MEKVIIINSFHHLSNNNVKEINEWLAKGWKVKSVVTESVKDDFITAIFVLEKDD